MNFCCCSINTIRWCLKLTDWLREKCNSCQLKISRKVVKTVAFCGNKTPFLWEKLISVHQLPDWDFLLRLSDRFKPLGILRLQFVAHLKPTGTILP